MILSLESCKIVLIYLLRWNVCEFNLQETIGYKTQFTIIKKLEEVALMMVTGLMVINILI